MIKVHNFSEGECRINALSAIDKMVALAESPDPWDIADGVVTWLFLLGVKNPPSGGELIGMSADELRELRKNVESFAVEGVE